MLKQPLWFYLFFSFLPGIATATPIDFDFRDPVIESLDDRAELSLERLGITLTAIASNGVFNRTSAGFGINAEGAGDDTDTIDAGSGLVEFIDIVFDVDVSLLGFAVSGLGASDSGAYILDGLITGFSTSGFIDLGGLNLATGKKIAVHHVGGNGFSLDSVTVQPYSTPEPSMVLLMCLGLPLLGLARLRTSRSDVRRGICRNGAGPA